MATVLVVVLLLNCCDMIEMVVRKKEIRMRQQKKDCGLQQFPMKKSQVSTNIIFGVSFVHQTHKLVFFGEHPKKLLHLHFCGTFFRFTSHFHIKKLGLWGCLRSYPCENTRSHPNSEVKHMWAGLVEWWVTTFESPVLKTFSFFLFFFCFSLYS